MISRESKASERVWSEEHDCIPLKQRLKILLATRSFAELNRTILPVEIVVKKEDVHYDKQELCVDSPPGFQPKGEYAQSNEPGVKQNSFGDDEAFPTTITKAHNGKDTLPQNITNSVDTSIITGLDPIKVKSTVPDNFLDELDHVVLKERKRMLLSKSNPALGSFTRKTPRFAPRKPLGSSKHLKEGLVCQESSTKANKKDSLSLKTSHSDSSYQKPRRQLCYPSKNPKFGDFNLCGSKDFNNQATLHPRLKTSENVKVEPLDCNELQNPINFAAFTAVKTESSSTDESDECLDDELDHMLLRDRINLMVSTDEDLEINEFGKCIYSKKLFTSSLNYKPLRVESAPVTIKRTRKRKKTATDSVETALEEDAPGLLQVLVDKGVTVDEIKLYGESESNELIDESSTEDSFSDLEAVMSHVFFKNPSFIKLALSRCRKGEGEKTTYCLSCLISLVEQARYLASRKYPVEWGWCRDLQSFIFVFERHNRFYFHADDPLFTYVSPSFANLNEHQVCGRIVLERPEYGYATYFFELVETFPIDWQIKRLVTAMKLSNCTRITLIEDRIFKVEDMSEGEAKVLMNYGWVPNTGFGTMLNYRDRVVHDHRNENESSEWRSKIGKLLINGYNGGRVVPSEFPPTLPDEKGDEYFADSPPQVKLET